MGLVWLTGLVTTIVGGEGPAPASPRGGFSLFLHGLQPSLAPDETMVVLFFAVCPFPTLMPW